MSQNPDSVRRYDDRDMAEAYLAGYMSAEAVWTHGTEACVQRVEEIADEFGEWIEAYDIEVYPEQIDGSVDKNPNQGRGADLVRTEGEGGSRSAADAGIGGAHDASDGRVGQDHAGAPSELKPATDGDRASDPPGATHTPSLLDRRRAKDIGLMKSAQRRTLDDEGICTRCGAPDVHCMCGDVAAQIDGSGAGDE